MLQHRLNRLRGEKEFYSILALDHGMTFGHSTEATALPVSRLLESCRDHISGFVVNYGIAHSLERWPAPTSLILQCFGALRGNSKRQTATVEQALRLDAAAVAVQLTFSDSEIGARMSEVSAFTVVAHAAGLPVLYMVGDVATEQDVPMSIRICQEMGADLVKLTCAADGFRSDSPAMLDALRAGPPVVIAGGTATSEVFQLAQDAAASGFSGYCVGRSIFRSLDPAEVAARLNTIFSTKHEGTTYGRDRTH